MIDKLAAAFGTYMGSPVEENLFRLEMMLYYTYVLKVWSEEDHWKKHLLLAFTKYPPPPYPQIKKCTNTLLPAIYVHLLLWAEFIIIANKATLNRTEHETNWAEHAEMLHLNVWVQRIQEVRDECMIVIPSADQHHTFHLLLVYSFSNACCFVCLAFFSETWLF